jgi:GAF domain-containing protein
VLKQISRIVTFDSCALALVEGENLFRVLAVRGFPEPSAAVGRRVMDPLCEEIRRSRFSLSIPDVSEEPRFVALPGGPTTRSWAAIPLLVEGECIGLLTLGRSRVEAFDEEDLHRARALAFSAAAAIRKAQLLEQVRRYATLMETVVAVDHAVFTGQTPAEVAQVILDGALGIGNYRGGLLVLAEGGAPRIEATTIGALANVWRKPAPPALDARQTTRLTGEPAAAVARSLGLAPGTQDIYMVPLATSDRHLGTLVLLDLDGDSPDDRLMESFASRAATAYLHARTERR